MLQVSINECINAVMDFCRENRSPDTINCYQKACDFVVRAYGDRFITEYDQHLHEELLQASRKRVLESSSSQEWFERYVFRVLSMIQDYYSGNPFREKYFLTGRFKHYLSPFFETIAEEFRSSLKQKPLTVPVLYSIARDFFHYLQEKGVNDFSKITQETIYGFLMEEYCDHSGCMGNVCYVTRLLLDFLRSQGHQNIPSELMPFSLPPSGRKVLPALQEEELESIISSIDRSTVGGKRNYAMLMLATCTGLRSIDIANLRLLDINWADLTIYLVQHKTSAGLALPLDAGVAAAVADYILNARPEVEIPYVFLTECKPYRKLSDKSSVSNVFNKYVRLSGIDKKPFDGKSFHAIRRTVGSWLLKSGTSPEMISQILGHQDKTVLKRYLPIEQESMRICALGFSGIPLKSEVYA